MLRFLALLSSYFAAGWLGLRMPAVDAHITLIWLPTGIAVAGLFCWGRGLWPAVALGALLVNLTIGSPSLAVAIALGNTLAPLLAVELLLRTGFLASFARQRDPLLLLLAAAVGMLISAGGGALSLLLAGVIPAAAFASAFLTWWLGDAVGVLLGAPLCMLILAGWRRPGWRELREMLAWLVLALLFGWFIFLRSDSATGHLPLAFLPVSLVALAAMRFGIAGAVIPSLAFSVLAVFGSATGRGVFALHDAAQVPYLVWAFMTTCVVTGLLITALQAERKRMESTLRESEQKLRGLYELSPIGIAMTDMQGRYLEFNQAFLQICGYSADELRALDYWQLTPRHYEADEQRQLEQLQRTGRYGPYEKEYIRKDGSLIPLLLNGTLVSDRDGQSCIWSFVEDTTESRRIQRQMQAVLAEQRAMLENDLIVIFRVSQRIIRWTNRAFDRLLGYQPDELIGQSTRVLYPDEAGYLALGEAAYPLLAQGLVYRAEHQFVTKTAEIRWVEVSGAMLDLDNGESLWALVDVSERRRSQAALSQAKEAADAANAAKSQFLATMAHEIRTPLNGVLGMAQLLLQEELSERERRDYARIILGSGQVLLTLLNDILDFSKIEADKLQLQSVVFHPAQLLAETAALFAELARSKNLQLEQCWHGDARGRYRGDPVRLRQMLSNLIGNAIKFTSVGIVRIEARELALADDRAELEFSVSDDGIGISQEQQALLFQPFSQVDASNTRAYGGTGLGLSIVRKLALMMQGDVGVRSREGEGSCFWFRVRVEPVAADDEAREQLRDRGGQSDLPQIARLVLVVEDNATNRIVVEAMLKKLGQRVECVEHGLAAVERLSRLPRPDLVLMDCQMPVMDGYEATRQIRQQELARGQSPIPIIALTAGAYEADRQQCLQAGMDAFLSKPVMLKDLQAILPSLPAADGSAPHLTGSSP
ncbi:PAS domain S-box protein [Chitinilyticum piscinae]|uniref:Sensory/regulatory protein RpfC n=1 Tax=Chitinilyticum piscinae TaxID=2866724 RepID=A0A8J7K0H0_9NEIS|nr:PAS domain S-box protein [Chitinilyticum piscinae]MBE9608021.1 PAS domain S-box protein [Chitinilyticum piscinae]